MTDEELRDGHAVQVPAPGVRTPGMSLVLALRLVHPFPSVLDGAATAAIGAAAGGAPATALRLGLAMILIQFAIGATNDVVDAPFDRGRPAKPVAAGVVSPRTATAVAIGCALAGLGLVVPSGLPCLAIAVAGLGVGLGYDLRLKRTPWAWLALAVAIPLLVVFAWYGATGTVDPLLAVSTPIAGLAGASLAIGNALVDPDHDRRTGATTPVVAFGPETAWRAAFALQVSTAVAAAASLAAIGGEPVAVAAALAAGALAVAGFVPMRAGRVARRERGWEIQAIGVALLGTIWVVGAALR